VKRIVFIASVTIVLGGGILLLLAPDHHQDDALEHARRLVCQNNQKSIYSALLQYRKKKMERSLLILRHSYKMNTFAKKISTARVTLMALIFRPTNIILIISVILTCL